MWEEVKGEASMRVRAWLVCLCRSPVSSLSPLANTSVGRSTIQTGYAQFNRLGIQFRGYAQFNRLYAQSRGTQQALCNHTILAFCHAAPPENPFESEAALLSRPFLACGDKGESDSWPDLHGLCLAWNGCRRRLTESRWSFPYPWSKAIRGKDMK